jgi:hypothetical protein
MSQAESMLERGLDTIVYALRAVYTMDAFVIKQLKTWKKQRG